MEEGEERKREEKREGHLDAPLEPPMKGTRVKQSACGVP